MSLEIKKGHSLVVHCRMGIGRSSLIAASILLKMGNQSNVKDIIDKISIIRGLQVPDTEAQISWLKKNRAKK